MRPTPATQLSAVARDGDGAVAAYVFAHEYAVPPSGGPGPEVYRALRRHPPGAPRPRPGHRAARRACSTVPARRAIATASLYVDTENPTGALGIYERAGFRQSYRQDFYHLDE